MARHCVVLAGGLGTRLRPITGGLVPKVLVPVLDTPFITHKLQSLREMKIDEATILVGELGGMVESYLTDHSIPGLVTHCVHDGPNLLGTGGSIARALPHLPDEFWVTYGDSLMYTDLVAAEHACKQFGLTTIVSVLRNRNQLEKSNMVVSGHRLVKYLKSNQDETFEWIDLGLLRFQKSDFDGVSGETSTDLASILSRLIEERKVFAWEEEQRFWDIGTPEALHSTELWLGSRSVQQKDPE